MSHTCPASLQTIGFLQICRQHPSLPEIQYFTCDGREHHFLCFIQLVSYRSIHIIYIYTSIYTCMHLGEHPSFFDNPTSANCLLYLTCLMVNLLYFLINPSPSHPRVEEFEMAKNYAFSYSPENSCILGDLSLRRHA